MAEHIEQHDFDSVTTNDDMKSNSYKSGQDALNFEANGKSFGLVEHAHPWRYEQDGLTVTRGSAWSGPGCHDGCGVLMYSDADGHLVKVEGDPENPYNQGRLCVRCIAVPEAITNPSRLRYPMKRERADRGKDKWQRISWDEAYDLIYQNFQRFKEESGAESVLFCQGTGRDIAQYITRLMYSFGSPHYVLNISGMSCYAPRVTACFATTGSFWLGDYSQEFADRYDNPEWHRPERIVVWGNNPLVSNSDGLYGHWVVDCMRLGSELIVVDPKCTWLASRARQFLQIRPGTDGALALGMINVIIAEDLWDHDFVDKWCYGFDELKEAVSAYTPEAVAEITWLEADEIVQAARDLAQAESAILQWGVAIDMTKETIPASQALLALFEITGNIEKPGAMIAPPTLLYYGGGWGGEWLPEGQDQKRCGYDKYPLVGQAFIMSQTDEMISQLETDQPYRLRGAWIETTNFLACTSPDPERELAAYNNLEFIACVDLFMTPTIMALGDVVLPALMYPERDGLRVGDGAQRGETINKAIETETEGRSDMQICLELGRRFNPEAWPWNDVQEMFDDILKPSGFDFKSMREVAPAYIPFEYHKHEKGMLRLDGKPGFNTPTGRLELWSSFLSNLGLNPLPEFFEPSPGPKSTPELFKDYPLILTTGARPWGYFHSEHRQFPHLRALHPEPVMEMNQHTADKYGVSDGEWAWVENDRGKCKRIVKVNQGVMDGVVSADHAWWHPEGSPDNLYDLWDLAVGNLLAFDPGKAGFGCTYKSTLCRVRPLEKEDN
ncbi:MAG: molybdopterin-dependent oxidoreductase [Coriobacteriales bacterium]|jgi:anaerobic selenocysteine-containing dehydrogenase|nr:molybdopterin-dependent oxidoreductase [Coriobacteriales bacterium]